jgi:hypothetical protein
MPVPAQVSLGLEVLPEVPLPRTVGDCRGPGICPKFGCEFNVVLHVTRSIRQPRGTDPGRSVETINIGGCGGKGSGESLASRRTMRGKVKFRDLERIVDAAVAACDALPATCVLDYIEDPDLIPSPAKPGDDSDGRNASNAAAHMTLRQIAQVVGVTHAAVHNIESGALAKAKEADGFAEWVELVLELVRIRDRKRAIPAGTTRNEFTELDAALDRAIARIEAERREELIPAERLVRRSDTESST